MAKAKIIDLTLDNVGKYGLFCLSNPKQEGYQAKLKWLKKRFAEGLRFKLIIPEGEKPAGFIEYIPGEYNWRAVDAPGWMVIHCMFVYPGKNQHLGYGTRLVQTCIDDAKKQNMQGVAVLTSGGTWAPDRRLFEKLGFEITAESGRFELMVKKLKRGPLPKFRSWEAKLEKSGGWQLLAAHQCPYHAAAMQTISEEAGDHGLNLKVCELKTAKQAQSAPAAFGVFALVHGGRLLADHYISRTRLRNILKQESA